MRTIALWSSDYSKFNGQAIVTKRVVDAITDVICVQYIYKGGAFLGIFSWSICCLRLFCDLFKRNYSVLYIVCSRSNLGFIRDIPALISSFFGVRVIVHIHGSDILDLLGSRRVSWLARGLYRRCELIVPSSHLVVPLERLVGRNVTVCENFCPSSGKSRGKVLDTSDHGAFVVLWNSNIMSSKGFFDVAESVRSLLRDGLDVQLLSLGRPLSDEEMSEESVEKQLLALQRESWFVYCGNVSPGAVWDFVAKADAVCLPSRYSSECQPLALVQAMCAGKALVVGDTPALRATIGDYPACFVPVSSTYAVTAALRSLYEARRSMAVPFHELNALAIRDANIRFSEIRFDREIAAILQ